MAKLDGTVEATDGDVDDGWVTSVVVDRAGLMSAGPGAFEV
jgi:hypothetical protein